VLLVSHEDAGRGALFEGLVRACSSQAESQCRGGSSNELSWAFCSTPRRRFAFLHAPGRRAAIPEFIRGAAQADVAVLAVPASLHDASVGWWTLEHAAIARALGIIRFVIAVTSAAESQDADVESGFWATVSQLQPRLQEYGVTGAAFVPARIAPIPAAGSGPSTAATPSPTKAGTPVEGGGVTHVLVRLNQRDPMLAWYDGEPLLKVLEVQDAPCRTGGLSPLRVLMLGSRQEGAGASLIGRVVQGSVHRGTECLLRPGWRRLLAQRVRDPLSSGGEGQYSSESSTVASAGDYVDLLVTPMPDSAPMNRSADASAGPQPLPVSGLKSSALWGSSAGESQQWLVELRVLELEEGEQPKVGRGFYGMLYFGAEAVGAEIVELIEALDLVKQVRSGPPTEAHPGSLTQCIVKLRRPTALDTFAGGQLGRFVLRRAGHTVGVGKVVAAAVAPS